MKPDYLLLSVVPFDALSQSVLSVCVSFASIIRLYADSRLLYRASCLFCIFLEFGLFLVLRPPFLFYHIICDMVLL